jgi:ParB family chromosome partitioning protein
MAGQKKNGLGRGLDALFGEIDTSVPVRREERGEDVTEGSIIYVSLDDIKPNVMQPRKAFSDETLENLAQSIESHGVIQPVMLKKKDKGYELVAGERRWRAARRAGLKEIPAIIRELNQEENALFAIIENMQREDLNPMEEAAAFRRVIDTYHLTQDNLSKSVGKSRPYIANTLRLLKLPERIRELLESGELTLGHANAIGGLKDEKKQVELALQIARQGLSVREAESLSAKVNGRHTTARPKAKTKRKSEEVRGVEEELTSIVGTRVTIDSNGKNGVIEIHYYSREELDGLIDDLRRLRK